MIHLAPDVGHQILENAAPDGKEVNDYLRLILQHTSRPNGAVKRLAPEDYTDAGKDWTEEDVQHDLDWAMRQKPNL